VTHDQEEALTMSDTVVVMKDGEIQQIGTPQDIYNEPTNAFVADFIGESNIIDGMMKKDYLVEFCGVEFECVDSGFGSMQPIDVVIRPEDISLSSVQNSCLAGIVESVIFKGVHYEMTVACNGIQWLIHSTKCEEVGTQVGLSFGPEDIHIMNKLVPFDTNKVEGIVTDTDTIEFLGVSFTRENLGLEAETPVILTIHPKDIEVVSEDISDLTVYLESLIYKGAHNELIVYTHERELIVHSQNDEQVATDIGVKFNFDHIIIEPSLKKEEG
ncbi:MAG: spermidine/putrescine transport ATP-binding protein, partial [Oscillospiraceae bacterium]|nr:spermidine/putrescine transport ATP-binding protein [Oscillospiraceae bacterium]